MIDPFSIFFFVVVPIKLLSKLGGIPVPGLSIVNIDFFNFVPVFMSILAATLFRINGLNFCSDFVILILL